ncbi:PfaD family polyunsaturated fatty acid/polyketide biosynthesis protein [Saccharopolyspora sp. 6M]|uniref:PfaD family polyunsaturated fatty acid/polyketide biosynthesis protein n=1 Tax=Saccharopolyspora sp. 6M TaxID=2877237 RepID=UPI001CD25B74|nr:PfaD family polyunsaturated fatty acid/polyketide biosynthesis protein [Saccharopolyspora sp. 6M]MCA1227911.1 PfaD family polyunsaturated fatty acid/polyketide biosynthesis protein [Saccharopolyspora sp. 6M]
MRAVIFPGQGAQRRGMGEELFDAYPDAEQEASEILGRSIRRLCLEDPDKELGDTRCTQPALYVVGTLAHRRWREDGGTADRYAGHSLGEYCALHAAGAFDFATGLRLVRRRGELMAQARGGGMVAVLGLEPPRLRELLDEGGFGSLVVANDNAPAQQVVSGAVEVIGDLVPYLEAREVRCARLNVSGAFHSPLMAAAKDEFSRYLAEFRLGDPLVPVIANATALPYPPGETARLLAEQVVSPVRWTEGVRHLLDAGVTEFVELGGRVVGKLVEQIRAAPEPAPRPEPVAEAGSRPELTRRPEPVAEAARRPEPAPSPEPTPSPEPARPRAPERTAAVNGSSAPPVVPTGPPAADERATHLGSEVFRRRHGLRYAYAGGGLYRGVASPEMVVRFGRAGMLGVLGTGGLPPAEVERGVREIQRGLPDGRAYGVNLLADHDDPAAEREQVELLLRLGVRTVEASAFVRITPALVRFRASGLRAGPDGKPVCEHRILAKVSRPEIAAEFLAPPPRSILDGLRAEGALTDEQVRLAAQVPMSHDLTVEADSGGHTDGGIAAVLMPAMLGLRQRAVREHGYAEPICLGLAGGIGTPSAVAAAFLLGADYVLTGSINQCTAESAMSAPVKDVLQDIGVDDTGYAPAGDMFEMGAQVQVLRKGVFFPTRANKLFALHAHYDGWEQIPLRTRELVERTYFRRSAEEVWDEVCAHLRSRGREAQIAQAEQQPKLKLARLFRWYFHYSTKLAMSGDEHDKVNRQVHTGPALGAFNDWVRGTELHPWQHRHVDEIGRLLLDGAVETIGAAVEHWQATLAPGPNPSADTRRS